LAGWLVVSFVTSFAVGLAIRCAEELEDEWLCRVTQVPRFAASG
jgi:hypothetical protein